MRLVWGVVSSISEERPRLQRLLVTTSEGKSRAICYPSLSGRCAQGDKVLLNTTAVDLSLGTGGWHFVVARAGAGVALSDPSGGHIMKLRYTPLQRDVTCVEAIESPEHSVMEEATDLDGLPVVCCGLHSQVPVVAAAIKDQAPSMRVAYVMTDEASLPIALSDTVATCEKVGLLDCSITTGQAYGGRHEAINVHSGLLAARYVCVADIAIVCVGPGIVGTSTAFGHGGVAQGEAVNAAGALGGKPVACLRLSFADARPRHHGVSHHSLVALGRVALTRALIPVPRLPRDEAAHVDEALNDAGIWARHDRIDVEVGGLPDMRGIEPRSMGRSFEADPAFFLAAVAAGRAAVGLAGSSGHNL